MPNTTLGEAAPTAYLDFAQLLERLRQRVLRLRSVQVRSGQARYKSLSTSAQCPILNSQFPIPNSQFPIP
ncbi:hypothetical protein [Nostoc sp.]|uniref:hypothetical protein n=1 Tax=Nostoc sp. TaxID=1180 RepID=UPI002FF4819B